MSKTDDYDNLPTAQLVGYSDEPYDSSLQAAQILEDAVPIPSEDPTSNAPDRDRALADLAGHRGRMQADQESDAIARSSREARSREYFVRAAVRNANQNARMRKHNEDRAVRNPNSDVPVHKQKYEGPPPMPKEFYEGTYGKEYEVADYETGEYDTRDYDVSEYKSVYES